MIDAEDEPAPDVLAEAAVRPLARSQNGAEMPLNRISR